MTSVIAQVYVALEFCPSGRCCAWKGDARLELETKMGF